jgi:hypothetical protein
MHLLPHSYCYAPTAMHLLPRTYCRARIGRHLLPGTYLHASQRHFHLFKEISVQTAVVGLNFNALHTSVTVMWCWQRHTPCSEPRTYTAPHRNKSLTTYHVTLRTPIFFFFFFFFFVTLTTLFKHMEHSPGAADNWWCVIQKLPFLEPACSLPLSKNAVILPYSEPAASSSHYCR